MFSSLPETSSKGRSHALRNESSLELNTPNASGDIKLVQCLLKNLQGPQAAQIAVDFSVGLITTRWTKRFQEDCKKVGANALVDRRIDRAFGQTASVSKSIYTILLFNHARHDKNPSAYACLLQSVPLNANLKSNLNNPKPKTIRRDVVIQRIPPRMFRLLWRRH